MRFSNPEPNTGVNLSFEPFPSVFLEFVEQLQALPEATVVDLGAGSGEFGRFLKIYGIETIELDCSVLAQGSSIALRADALQPPLLPQSIDCLLAGNLWRHLSVQKNLKLVLADWLGLLKPGGRLFIFEDEPDFNDPSAVNFKELQAFLAQLQPHYRGPLISLDFFLEWAGKNFPLQTWLSGLETNQNSPDISAVLEMLTGQGINPKPTGTAGRLLKSINNHGLNYGKYWWVCGQKRIVD